MSTPRELLYQSLLRIRDQLTDIEIGEMTKAEKNIARVLYDLNLISERTKPDHVYKPDTLGEDDD